MKKPRLKLTCPKLYTVLSSRRGNLNPILLPWLVSFSLYIVFQSWAINLIKCRNPRIQSTLGTGLGGRRGIERKFRLFPIYGSWLPKKDLIESPLSPDHEICRAENPNIEWVLCCMWWAACLPEWVHAQGIHLNFVTLFLTLLAKAH